ITEAQVKPEIIERVRKLNELAQEREQSLAQMAISWVLKDPRITSVILGASKPSQVTDAIKAIENTVFSPEELDRINKILQE
ncbi:MAG: aldo/keto reductase, partial [Bacteroidota bacterium]|nr:aldo/keto reductase [Bacteroidota bacterium]